MGNTLTEDKGKTNYMKAFEAYIDQNPELVSLNATLFENKLFRTLSYKTESMNLVVKVHLLRKQLTNLEVLIHENNFLYFIKQMGTSQYSNLLPYQKLMNFNDKSHFQMLPDKQIPSPEEQMTSNKEFLAVCRQQLHTTLKDMLHSSLSGRISKPKLNFIAMQILVAVNTLHNLKLYHGNIRTSNVLLTYNDHVALADFSPFKPYYLREDQLGENIIMFETSSQHCTLAPEKFVPSTEQLPINMELSKMFPSLLTSLQKMDMFSVGVVLAELYLKGEVIFTYEQLLQYRRAEYDPTQLIKKIGDPDIEELVLNLIKPTPAERFTAQDTLQYFFDKVLTQPKHQAYLWFSYLDQMVTWSQHFSQPDLQIQVVRKLFVQLLEEVCGDLEIAQKMSENGVVFQFVPPLVIQQVPVVNFFQKFMSDIQPKLPDMVKGLKNITINVEKINRFTNSFKPGTSSEFLLASEPYENAGNLRIRLFQERHMIFTQLKSVRQSQEWLRRTPVEKLRASQRMSQQSQDTRQKSAQFEDHTGESIGFLQQLEPPSEEISPTRSKSDSSQPQMLLREFKLKHRFLKSQDAHYLVQLICSQMQNVRFVASKLSALEMLEFLSMYLEESDNYYLTLPYIGAMFDDSDNQVVQQAFHVFLTILLQLEKPFTTPQEVKLFKLYYWEQLLKIIQNDDSAIQRFAFERIGDIAKVVAKYEEYARQFSADTRSDLVINCRDEFLQIITMKLEQANTTKNTELQERIIQNLGSICHTFREKSQLQSQQFLMILISCFNKPELKLCFIRNLAPVFEVYSANERDADFVLTCLDQCLYDQNELQMFYTVRFFRLVTETSLMTQAKEIQYLKIIAPLMVFPNLWIRTEAIGYVSTLVEKYSPMEMYMTLQPILVNYLKEDVHFLNAEIVQALVGDMINRQYIDFAGRKILDYGQRWSERERFIASAFEKQYLSKAKNAVGEKDEKEEKQNYQRHLEILDRRHDLEVSLGRRVNEFIVATFKANLFFYSGDHEDCFEEILKRYKSDQNQQLKTPDDVLILDILANQRKLEVKSDQISSRKLKVLQAQLQQFQSNLTYIISSKNIVSQQEFRNILNAMLIIHQIEVKARQIGVKEDFNMGKIAQSLPPNRIFKPQQQLVTTIQEHKDIVSSVQNFRDQRFFISGSHDGTVRIFDMNKIDQDFTAGSVSVVKCESQDKQFNKVTTLKALEQTDSFLVGTNTGLIQLYKMDHTAYREGKNLGVSQLRTFRKANSEIKKIESMSNDMSEAIFVYVTSMGEIVVEDIRSRSPAIQFSVGKERGLVTSMIQRSNSLSTCISTMNGYCVVYDLRCNLISNVFQLLSPEDQPLPIFSMANFKRVTALEGVEPVDMIGLGFQSNNNEVGFWNFNDLNENINPCLYLVCSDKKDIIIQNPRLKSLYKIEQFKNFSNTLEDRCQYDFVGSHQQLDLIAYLKDPLTNSSSLIKEKWLIQTKNCYANLKAAFDARSSVTSMICLPYHGQTNQPVPGKPVENSIITASTDRCIQLWTLAGDGGKPSEKQYDKDQQGTIICQPSNYYDFQRRFTQVKAGDVYVVHDYEVKTSQLPNMIGRDHQAPQNLRKEYRIDHKDCITDMSYLEREQGLLITCSRDQTIKIWK